MLQAKGKQRFFFMKKSNSCTVIECSIIHVYLLLFFSYISYHKSLDNEQRPMIHYAIFFLFYNLHIVHICRSCCYIYTPLLSFCTSVKSVSSPWHWLQCGKWVLDLLNKKIFIVSSLYFLYIHIYFISCIHFIFFHFYTTLRGSCKKSWWVCYICCTVCYASVFSHYKLILKNI